MADLDSWEDDKDAQDQQLSQQAQRSLNFNPSSANFRPGATSFQPQYQAYPQQQGYHGQQQQQSEYGYGGNYPSNGGYSQHNQYGYNQPYRPPQMGMQNQQNYNQIYQPPQTQQRTPIIATRPSAGQDGRATNAQAASGPAPADLSAPAAPQKAKVLSISADSASPKVEKTGQTKVLTIGSTAPASTPTAKEPMDTTTAEVGAKVTAGKALEKAGEPTEPAAMANSGKTSPTPSSGRQSPSRAEKRAAAREADTVAKEQAESVDEEILNTVYGKEHVNVIFLGHVDSGKSTLGGSILYATGMVDERTLDKYRREAKEAGRETWYLSWALDLTKEERAKGKTVEVGRGFFETEKRRYSILDAPGHKTFVPQAISGAAQADVGILVISARKGEYETGFEKGGQTREHAVLAKTQGVNKLIVVVNKCDDPTVEWSEKASRFTECITKLSAFLKSVGYNPSADLFFMPISAQAGLGVKERVPPNVCAWYQGPSLLEYLDNMTALERKTNAPFMCPIVAKYKDMGTMIEGKIEAGIIKKDGTYLLMPNREKITIASLYGETEDEIQAAQAGEQIRVRIRGVEEEDILPGSVLCSPSRPVHCVRAFEAQIVTLELRSILSPGFNCVMHVHSATEEVTFAALLHKLEKGTGRKSKKAPSFATRGMSIIARLEIIGVAGAICIETFEDYPQMGRFTLRDQGQTIAIGKVTKLIT